MNNIIYFIHCIENKNRYYNILHQINKVKLQNYQIIYTSKNQLFSNLIYQISKSDLVKDIKNIYELNCLIEHYRIIYMSYISNIKYCTIFEDDIEFLNDKNLFHEILNNIPDDADIIRYGGLSDMPFKIEDYNLINYYKLLNYGIYSTAGYTLSRNGMAYYLDFINHHLECADMPLFYNTNINPNLGLVNYKKNEIKQYISSVPLFYLKYKKFDKFNTTINNTQSVYNFYKNIDYNQYNE